MKRKIILIIVLLTSQLLYAQRDYDFFDQQDYTSDTLCMNGYTYVCDTLLLFKDICIYNIENHPGREMNICYKDGSPIKIESIDDLFSGRITEVVLDSNIRRKMYDIVDFGFSKEQALSVFPQKFDIVLNISSTDGTITDVYFWYKNKSKYIDVPLDVFRQLELALKNQVVFELTEEGRKMNYVYLQWSQCPQGRIEVTPTIPEVTDDSSGGGGFTGNPIGNNTDIITSAGGR